MNLDRLNLFRNFSALLQEKAQSWVFLTPEPKLRILLIVYNHKLIKFFDRYSHKRCAWVQYRLFICIWKDRLALNHEVLNVGLPVLLPCQFVPINAIRWTLCLILFYYHAFIVATKGEFRLLSMRNKEWDKFLVNDSTTLQCLNIWWTVFFI